MRCANELIRALHLSAWCAALIVGYLLDEHHANAQAITDDVAVTVRVSPSAMDRGTSAMREVAGRVDAAGVQLSVLTGRGGPAAARDLLFRNGVEFAVLRSDLLTYLARRGELPEAAQRLRYVTHLYTDKLYLWARADVKNVGELAGRTVAIIPDGEDVRVTAETLFDLVGGKARITEVDGKDLATETAAIDPDEPDREGTSGAAQAVLLVGAQMKRRRAEELQAAGYRLLPLTLTAVLGNAFVSAEVSRTEVNTEAVPTLGVVVLLATFGWKRAGDRFPKVARFMTGLYRSISDLRRSYPDSIWREVDIGGRVASWERYTYAAPGRFLRRSARSRLADVAPPREHLRMPPVATTVAATPPTQETRAAASRVAAAPPNPRDPISVTLLRRPPFSDDKNGDGSVVLEILNQALAPDTSNGNQKTDLKLQWADRRALLDETTDAVGSATASLPWQRPRCDAPQNLTRSGAILCDQAIFSKPLMRVVFGVYVDAARRGKLNGLRANTGSRQVSMTVCIPQDSEVGSVPRARTGEAAQPSLEFKVVRRASIVHCIAAAQTGEADGFLATDLEGNHATAALGLSGIFEIYEPTMSTDTLHVAGPRGNAVTADLIERINAGLDRLKKTGAYAKLIERHVLAALRLKR
ncbi:MAG: transporter substrate-binding domain-containing protein [Pseudomonadota bacterium]